MSPAKSLRVPKPVYSIAYLILPLEFLTGILKLCLKCNFDWNFQSNTVWNGTYSQMPLLWSLPVVLLCSSKSCMYAQSCPTLCDPLDCSLPVSSIHRISQARILEWVAISSSRGSFWPRNRTGVSSFGGRFFTDWPTREALFCCILKLRNVRHQICSSFSRLFGYVGPLEVSYIF